MKDFQKREAIQSLWDNDGQHTPKRYRNKGKGRQKDKVLVLNEQVDDSGPAEDFILSEECANNLYCHEHGPCLECIIRGEDGETDLSPLVLKTARELVAAVGRHFQVVRHEVIQIRFFGVVVDISEDGSLLVFLPNESPWDAKEYPYVTPELVKIKIGRASCRERV